VFYEHLTPGVTLHMKRTMTVGLLLSLLLTAACNRPSDSGSGAAEVTSAKAAGSAASAGGAGATRPATSTLGVADWHLVFMGDPPLTLPASYGGGQASGVADDYTYHLADPAQAPAPWKYGAVGGGGINWSPSRKAVVVTNINLKQDPTIKSVELWIKSALVKDVKHVGGPEILAIGPTKALVLTGAGTCTLKEGGAADFYWHDFYSPGDFAHSLTIVVVGKDAPEPEKEVAVTVLRQGKYTPKAKPHYKKP